MQRFDTRFVYTRYADDMAFSFDEPRTIARCVMLCRRSGASRVRADETKSGCSVPLAGRRMITGVAVDDTLHAPRWLKRRLRAARHKGRPSQVAGLEEWAKLKMPEKYENKDALAGFSAVSATKHVLPVKVRQIASQTA